MATRRAKYPRTWHLACSPGRHRDDRQHADDSHLVGREVVITEKLDGSGVSLHHDGVYARSKTGAPTHPSYDRLKALWASLAHRLEPDWSVFGEWCHAVHTIVYPDLPAERELALFGVRSDAAGRWWAWDEVATLAAELGLATAPVLWRGVLGDEDALRAKVAELVGQPSAFGPHREGIVVRRAAGFDDGQFTDAVSKWVRPGHVAGAHWSKREVVNHRDEAAAALLAQELGRQDGRRQRPR